MKHVSAQSDAINLTALRLEIQTAIATAKIAEFEIRLIGSGTLLPPAYSAAPPPPTCCLTSRQATASFSNMATISSKQSWPKASAELPNESHVRRKQYPRH